jgi:ABC-2 type transport system permease protein
MATTHLTADRAHVVSAPTRSTLASSQVALQARILRDLVVLRKHFGEFVVRTLVQPFLAVLRVFPPRLEQTARACGMASEGLS